MFKGNKKKNIMTIKFSNYLKSNIFISLDYYKSDKLYKLTWRDLELDDSDKRVSTEVLTDTLAEHILTILMSRPVVEYKDTSKTDLDKVTIEVMGNVYAYTRYIPKEYIFLVEVLIIISKCLPTMLDKFFVMTLASVTGEEYKYDYLNSVKLNILRENVNKLFQPNIIEIGEILKDNIKYIEKVDKNYYALVSDLVDYAVIIKEEGKNQFLLNCTCPRDYYCEHIYATLHAIKDKVEKPFYKVLYNDQEADLLDKLTHNKVVLSTGIKDDKIELINDLGQIGLLPIMNANNTCNWTVVEDDENKTLTNYLESMENVDDI